MQDPCAGLFGAGGALRRGGNCDLRVDAHLLPVYRALDMAGGVRADRCSLCARRGALRRGLAARRVSWTAALALIGVAIFVCFAGALVLGVARAAWLLPLTGLFMSIVYPTLNSKAISCFPKIATARLPA